MTASLFPLHTAADSAKGPSIELPPAIRHDGSIPAEKGKNSVIDQGLYRFFSGFQPVVQLAVGDWLQGAADLVTFSALAVTAVFLMWAPSHALTGWTRRIFAVILCACGILYLVHFWSHEFPLEQLPIIGKVSASLTLLMAVGLLLILMFRRSRAKDLQETQQSLAAAKQELTREQMLLATLVENMPDAIYFKDLESRFIRCNQKAADVFQLASPKEAIGKSDYDFFDRREADEYRADELHIIETGEPIINKEEYEFWKDGQYHWVLSTKMPLRDAEQNIIGTFGLSRDITQLKQTEEVLKQKLDELETLHAKYVREQNLFSTLIESIPDAVFFKDRDCRYIRVNPAMADAVGFSSTDEMIGLSDADIWGGELPTEALADELRIMDTGEPVIGKQERVAWRPDRRERWVLATRMPLRDTDGEIIGTFGVTRDITELRSYQDELTARSAALEQSNRELEQFAYVASHDLQEPLRTTVGFCQLLELEYQDKFDGNGRMYLNTIVEGGRRMQRLINDLLEYSRVGRQGNPFERVSLNHVIDEVRALLHSAIAESGATVEVADLPDVSADVGQMIRVFQNLVGNALKYRTDAVPHVRIRAEQADDEWNIYLSDNGIGIPKEFAEQVFIIFKRLHTREEYPGTGIGLAVCRRIIERHGGRIELMYDDEETSTGSTFRITLPAALSTGLNVNQDRNDSE